MKTMNYFVLAILLLGRAGNAGADLVAHYEFEGDAYDSSGNRLQGTLVGDAGIWLDDTRGNVLNVTGANGHVNCGNPPSFNITEAITVSAWVNFATVPTTWMGVVTKGAFGWRLMTAGNQARFHFAVAEPAAGMNSVNGSAAIPVNEWHHVCGTYDGANVRLYVDGYQEPQGPTAYAGPITTNASDVWIGGNAQIAGHEFDGLLDDVRIYDHALSAAEIAELAGRTDDGDWVIRGDNMHAGVSGNVGIGTADPSAKLEVVGTIKATDLEARSSVLSIRSKGDIEYQIDTNNSTALRAFFELFNGKGENIWWVDESGTMHVAGNTGLGVAIPQEKLHVGGRARFDVRSDSSISLSTPGGWPGIMAFTPNGHRRDIVFDDSSIRILTSDSSGSGDGQNGITVRENGSVGIGTSFPGAFKLAVNGTAAKAGGGSWSTFSDVRLKDVNGQYERGLSEITALSPVVYSYAEDNELKLPPNKTYVGAIAQEVRAVIPEAVEAGDRGYLTVNNDAIIWAMVNAIKELKAENEMLRQRLDTLEALAHHPKSPALPRAGSISD